MGLGNSGPGSASRRSFYPPPTSPLNPDASGLEPIQLSQHRTESMGKKPQIFTRRKRVIVWGGTLTLLARPRDLAEIAVHTRAGPENVAGQEG